LHCSFHLFVIYLHFVSLKDRRTRQIKPNRLVPNVILAKKTIGSESVNNCSFGFYHNFSESQ